LLTAPFKTWRQAEEEEKRKRLVPKSDGYQERDARFSTLDPALAAGFVARAQRRSQTMMATTRGAEIEAGLEHLTPAAIEIKAKRGLL
jgi:hypothetical protein